METTTAPMETTAAAAASMETTTTAMSPATLGPGVSAGSTESYCQRQ
jgi:hypothetical protein